MVWLEGFAALGVATFARFGFSTFRALRLRGSGSLVDISKHAGSWAVVTGSSDGIGAEYAKYLGSIGCNLLLVSRTESKLHNLAAQLRANHPDIKVKTVAIDLANQNVPLHDIFQDIESSLKEIEPIGVLVNNVAVNYEYPQAFSKTALQKDDAIVQVNISTLNRITKLVIPRMLHHKKGVVINLSSLTGTMPTPLLSVYSATKAYTELFSLNLHNELKKEGITVQCVTPGLVATKMSQSKPNWLVCTPEVVVQNTFKALGTSPRIIPFFTHRVCHWLSNMLPDSFIGNKLFEFNQKVGETAINKQLLRERKRIHQKEKHVKFQRKSKMEK